MIKFEHTEVVGWQAAIRGMRNPKNSWEKSDSLFDIAVDPDRKDPNTLETMPASGRDICGATYFAPREAQQSGTTTFIGPDDYDLMKRLRNAGTDHRKFMRMIIVYTDITAPLYWWKEFDTYKVGTVANSCSTMHTIADKEFTLEDFSCEHLMDINTDLRFSFYDELHDLNISPIGVFGTTLDALNYYRSKYLITEDKKYWWAMIHLLPSSYNQKRTIMMSYEVLANIYKSRKDHKLDEWRIGFREWIKDLPCSELITGEREK